MVEYNIQQVGSSFDVRLIQQLPSNQIFQMREEVISGEEESPSFEEEEEKLEQIENLVSGAKPLNPERRQEVLRTLNATHYRLVKMESKAVEINDIAQASMQKLSEKTVSLYGKLDDQMIQYEVCQIQKEAESLEKTMGKKDMAALAKAVDALQEHINSLFDSYSPSLAQRRIIVIARLILDRATDLMEGREVDLSLDVDALAYTQAEAVLEEIVDLLGQNKNSAAKMRFNSLSPAQRKILLYYLPPHDLITNMLQETAC